MLYVVIPRDQNNSFKITGNKGLMTLRKNVTSKSVSSCKDAATGSLPIYIMVSNEIHSRNLATTAATAAPCIPSSGKPKFPKISVYESKVLISRAHTLIIVGVLTLPVE